MTHPGSPFRWQFLCPPALPGLRLSHELPNQCRLLPDSRALRADLSKQSWLPPHLGPQVWEERVCLESAFDGAGPDPQGSFSLSPAKFPGCSSAVRLPSPERLLAPSAAGNGPDNCSSRAGDFSICICMDPTHASSPKPQLVFSS